MKWPSASGGRQSSPCTVEVPHTTTLGRAVSASAAAIASANAAVSWPSMSWACQPKAAHFSAIGSIVVIVSTGPSTWELLLSSKHDEAAQAEVSSEDRRLPNLALLHLAVTDEREGARGGTTETVRQGEPGSSGEALTE